MTNTSLLLSYFFLFLYGNLFVKSDYNYLMYKINVFKNNESTIKCYHNNDIIFLSDDCVSFNSTTYNTTVFNNDDVKTELVTLCDVSKEVQIFSLDNSYNGLFLTFLCNNNDSYWFVDILENGIGNNVPTCIDGEVNNKKVKSELQDSLDKEKVLLSTFCKVSHGDCRMWFKKHIFYK
ncbi:hypothetical protein [Lumpy skin disease virus]|uniref:LS132 n=1 Tax=Lumpy skin disease virus TaxID=59509 RepID=A0A1C9HHZ0_LSDV|nr:hypothetical protein [Lumpy skin disease virus]AOO78692.1 hypothetical protein [Lumpy skin disease virus]AOO78851.1 hypothetical protein [Lumpy skin disease virus]AOO79009.1 hypothetical protein [Lumpy skin disease virus]AVR51569.1 hypothetical protein [Lumpy skin disease virus]